MSSKNTHKGGRRPIPVLGWLLRTRARKVTAGVMALLMVGGVAWAAYVITAGMTGTVSSGALVATWVPSSAVTVTPGASNAGAVCGTASVDASGVLHMTGITNALPGDSCTFTGQVALTNGSTVTAAVNGVALPDLPPHFGVTMPQGCGAVLNTGGSPAPATVSVTITAGPSVAPGETGTLVATSDGVQAVPQVQFASCLTSPTAS